MKFRTSRLLLFSVVSLSSIFLITRFCRSAAEPPPSAMTAALQKADKLFKEQNWAEARDAYSAARKLNPDWHAAPVRLAVEGGVACQVKLRLWDDALARAQQFVDQTGNSFAGAVGERFLGSLYLSVPHYGTKRGSTFLRGQWVQGVQVRSFKKDRKDALLHYDRARAILLGLGTAGEKDPEAFRKIIEAERIGLDFDTATALAQQDGYNQWGWAGWWWGSWLEPEEDSSEVDDADYEQGRWGRWGGDGNQTMPTGIPLGPDGKPRFMPTPTTYSPAEGTGPKIRFLLKEIQTLDTSTSKDDAGRALLRWAMVARSLYGPDIVAQYSASQVQYDRFGQPLPARSDAPHKPLWELTDNEALTLAGGKLDVVELPADESPIALLRQVEARYPRSSAAPEAHYALALYYQTRQQFPQAIHEYESVSQRYPFNKRAGDARSQIQPIQKPGVYLGNSGVYLPGQKPKLSFSYRAADTIQFKATRLDLNGYVHERMESHEDNWWNYRNIGYDLFQTPENKSNLPARYVKYLGAEAAHWTQAVPRTPGYRAAEGSTLAPLPEPGAYIVEATTPGGGEPSRLLVLVTDIAIVQKNMIGKGLIYLADARTGQALPGLSVEVYEHWNEYKDSKNSLLWEKTTLTTNQDGVIEYTMKHGNQVDAVVNASDRRMAYSFFQSWSQYNGGEQEDNGTRTYVMTDRPVYRPLSTVHCAVWVRQRVDRLFQAAQKGQDVLLTLYDAKKNEVKAVNAKTDNDGCAAVDFEIGAEPPLGVYHIAVNNTNPDGRQVAGGLFRIEEYKKPEFEVTVKPTTDHARLGDKVKARISARYFFGTAVAHATVSYKVFREDYHHVYYGPGEYDWLYGAGYGRVGYAYPWMPWWGEWGRMVVPDLWWPGVDVIGYAGYYPWGYYGQNNGGYQTNTRKALRELVAQGTAELSANGSYDIEFDTAKAKAELPNEDHRYTVEAEVRDASRRTIAGQGSVIVTRKEFYAYVQTDAGWYQPKNEAFVHVRTLTPDNTPVTAKGEVQVYRIRYSNGGAQEHEDLLKEWAAATDVEGRLDFKYPVPSEGQYRIVFKTQDSWKQQVLGNAVFWVSGPKFDGRVYRFNDLEIIADRRTYSIGETAHLMMNTAEDNARVLFSDHVSNGAIQDYRFINIPHRSIVIDVPITEKQVPNFFVEATLVRDGRVHTEERELYVPPVRGLLQVSVHSDKETYRAGDTGHVKVTVRDAEGRPAHGEVTLTVYDKAVTYIQDEYGPSPRVFYYGQQRTHSPQVDSSLNESFSATGYFDRPEYDTYLYGEPDGWRGAWALQPNGLSLSGSEAQLGISSYAQRGLFYGGIDVNGAILSNGVFGGGGGFGGGMPVAKAVMTAAPVNGPMDAAAGAVDALSMTGRHGAAPVPKPEQPESTLVDPVIRSNFADTAFWAPRLTLDAKGEAEASVTFPQSLSTWRLHAYAITPTTQVGDATAEAVTTKKLIVRLQSPRFFVERDEVVLSANVHNYLMSAKKVRAELIIPAKLLQPLDGSAAPDAGGNIHLFAERVVKSNDETRFDWPVKAVAPGLATITVRALTDEESDGMRMAFPVLIHGINKTVAQGGSFRVAQDGDRTINLTLPQEIDPAQTRLEVTLSPSLAGVMIDALPYLAGYLYGCTEQTMSRFYPSVLVKGALQKMGTNLEAVAKQRKQMNEQDVQHRFAHLPDSPVFNSAELDAMVRAGLERITSFQHPDGGWGWWKDDDSTPYETCYVLQGLHDAREAGIAINQNVYQQGMNYLANFAQGELIKPPKQQWLGDVQTQAYLAYVLSLDHRLQSPEQKKWLAALFEGRDHLNNYGKLLLCLAMHNEGQKENAATLLRNVLQFVDRDDTNETAWVRTPDTYWWFWWNNDIETNAWALKALVAVDPQNDLAPRIVKWLLNNRRNGYYWRSTRDTALTIAAMADYMKVSGEGGPNYTLTVKVDGKPVKEVKISKANFFTFDNRVLLTGTEVGPGPHKITLTKTGPGALYYSAYLSYFTKEEDVKGAGNEILIDREYYKLVPKTDTVNLPDAGLANTLPAGQGTPLDASGHTEARAGFDRVLLHNGDAVKSGDQIEVVLKITAKNTYDYLAFEDMKPAGCEPVELTSGGRYAGGLCANLELRDTKVVFFIGLLEQGQHEIRYRLRAETPGSFHALPTTGYAMYAPEVRAISDEMRLKISE